MGPELYQILYLVIFHSFHFGNSYCNALTRAITRYEWALHIYTLLHISHLMIKNDHIWSRSHDHLWSCNTFFQNGIAYKVWLSASESSDIFVPYILFLTLNWGYDDAMGHAVFNWSGHCHSWIHIEIDAKWHIYMYQFPKIPNWVNQLIKQASQLNSHLNLMQNA